MQTLDNAKPLRIPTSDLQDVCIEFYNKGYMEPYIWDEPNYKMQKAIYEAVKSVRRSAMSERTQAIADLCWFNCTELVWLTGLN